MIVELPTQYDIEYPYENVNYYSDTNGLKPWFQSQLLLASSSYCMYCGKSLVSDGNIHCNMEHVVDKGGVNAKSLLVNCKFNLAVSCETCNQRYKSRVDRLDLDSFENIERCPQTKCKKICKKYRSLRNAYCKTNAILLPPQGTVGKNHEILRFGYNVFSGYFSPIADYQIEDLLYIQRHIYRFHLNGSMLTNSITDLCIEIYSLCDAGIEISKIFELEFHRRQPNIVSMLFMIYLVEHFKEKESIKLKEYCMLVVVESVLM